MTGSPSLSREWREWSVRTRRGTAAELHRVDTGARPDAVSTHGDAKGRILTLCRPSRAAVVLGSAQPATDIDEAAAHALGLEVARRRSGGGAVFVDPDDSIWIEAWIPRADPLWVDDVSSSMLWLGRTFVDVLAGDPRFDRPAEVVTGPYDAGSWGRTICFMSEAPGEVRGQQGKIVGISQRRDRDGARFQAIVYRRWDPARWQVFRDPGAARALDGLAVECVDAEPERLAERLAARLAGTV